MYAEIKKCNDDIVLFTLLRSMPSVEDDEGISLHIQQTVAVSQDGTYGSVIGVSRASRIPQEPFYVGIATPAPDQEFTPFIDGFFEMVRKMQEGCATENDLFTLPTGVRLVNNRITHLSSKREYRETVEFETTGQELGAGNSGDPIRVVKDNVNGIAHALKSYYIDKGVVEKYQLEEFKENEVRCWVDLNKRKFVPELYLFQVQDSKVMLHMEELDNVLTLRSLIFKHRPKIAAQPTLLKPWALNIFRLLLSAMREFHSKGWTHNDLHSENVLIRMRPNRPPQLYILDFGAVKLSGNIQQDMQDIAGLFQGLLFGFDNKAMDYARKNFTIEERKEISHLLDKCSVIVNKRDLPEYIRQVQSSLFAAKKKCGHGNSNKEMFMKITTIMSSEPGCSPRPILDDDIVLPSPPKSPKSSLLEQTKEESQTIKRDCLDGRGDCADLNQRLAKLKFGSTEKEDLVVPALANSPVNSQLVTYRNRYSEQIHNIKAADDGLSNEQEARNTNEVDKRALS